MSAAFVPVRVFKGPLEFSARLNEGEPVLTLEQLGDRYVSLMLEYTGGNKQHAAELLGIDRRTLYRKIAGKR